MKKPSQLFETALPIIQAPMAGVQDSALTLAVCRAGGLGSLPCGMLSIEQIVDEINTIRSNTDKAYNLNFFCHTVPDYHHAQSLQWQELLQPYFAEHKTTAQSAQNRPSRTPFNHDIADAIEPFKPPFISFHFGLPDKQLLERIKSWGTKIISSATTLKEALWLAEHAVDGIIAQGVEAGGHRGMFLSNDISTQMGLMALVPQIATQVDIPIIAAGGIGNSNQVRAALSLGADAVQVGTAYLLCSELKTTKLHRLAITDKKSQHTALTNIFSGKPARGIVNRAMQELGYMNTTVPDFPYASIEMAQLRRLFESIDKDDFSPLWCGQNTMGCQEISAYDLTLQLAEGLHP